MPQIDPVFLYFEFFNENEPIYSLQTVYEKYPVEVNLMELKL